MPRLTPKEKLDRLKIRFDDCEYLGISKTTSKWIQAALDSAFLYGQLDELRVFSTAISKINAHLEKGKPLC